MEWSVVARLVHRCISPDSEPDDSCGVEAPHPSEPSAAKISAAGTAVLAALLAAPVLATSDDAAYSTFFPVMTVRDSGPSANRYNVVFAMDGFTAAQDERAQALAQEIADYLVTPAAEKPEHEACLRTQGGCRIDTEPYVRYRNFLNFDRVAAHSKAYFDVDDLNDSGKVRFNDGRDLFRDSIFGLTKGVVQAVEGTAQDSADGAGIDMNGRGWLAESGIRFALPPWPQVSASHHLPGELFAHEGGHANHGLWDEYYYPGGGRYVGVDPIAWNVTTDSACAKWDEWIGYDDRRVSPTTRHPLGVIGCHEGAQRYDTGLYRPVGPRKSSRMWTDNPFNRVSMERVIYDIYGAVRPLDSYQDTTTVLVNPSMLWVDEVDPAVIKVDWTVSRDGAILATLGDHGGILDIAALGLGSGTYTITAHAYDEAVKYAYTASGPAGVDLGDLDSLDIVRKPEVIERMQQEVAWNVMLSAEAALDTAAGIRIPAGQRFTVDRGHPNGAIVGWVRADAPHGHTFALTGAPDWLQIDAHTGRLEVGDAAALAGEAPGVVSVEVSASVARPAITARGNIAIDINDVRLGMVDDFDDGEPGANLEANGRGFAVLRATSTKPVREEDGALVLENYETNRRGEVIVLSKDSFDLGTDRDVEITWALAPANVSSAVCHVYLAPARAPLNEHASGYRQSPDFGLHVSVCGKTGSVLVSTPLKYKTPYKLLSEWDWKVRVGRDPSDPVVIKLVGNGAGYRVHANDVPVAEGGWPQELGELSGLFQPAEPWHHRTVRVGAMLLGRANAALRIDRIEVVTESSDLIEGERPPPPTSTPKLSEGGIPDVSVSVEEPFELDLGGYFNGGALSFSATVLPPGVELSAAGKIRGALDQTGDHQITALATIGDVTATGSFHIRVEQMPRFALRAGEPVQIPVAGWLFADDDPGTGPYTVAGLPDGLHYDNGMITGDAKNPGQARVSVSSADDNTIRQYAILFDITEPANQPPVGFIPDQVLVAGREAMLDLSEWFSDPDDDDPLTFKAHGLPDGLTLRDGKISGVPTRVDAGEGVRVTVSDGPNETEFWFMITVRSNEFLEVPRIDPPVWK